jgi:hypothetical protein
MPKSTPREEAALKKLDASSNAPKYVSCDLSKAQKESLTVYIQDTDLEELVKWMCDKVSDEYTITMRSLDVGYQCSLTGTPKQRANAGACLISRSDSPLRSIWSVMFKTVEILPPIWPISNRLEDLD